MCYTRVRTCQQNFAKEVDQFVPELCINTKLDTAIERIPGLIANRPYQNVSGLYPSTKKLNVSSSPYHHFPLIRTPPTRPPSTSRFSQSSTANINGIPTGYTPMKIAAAAAYALYASEVQSWTASRSQKCLYCTVVVCTETNNDARTIV